MNVAHTSIDLKNDKANYNKSAGYTQAEIDELEKLIECGFEDSYRRLYPETEAYTFWSYRGGGRQKNVGWRLDYFLLQVRLNFYQPQRLKIMKQVHFKSI